MYFVCDLDTRMSDSEIWEHAKRHQLIILTKDTDFLVKSLRDDIGPKVIHFKLGNLSLSELHKYFSEFWSLLVKEIRSAKIILAYRDHIEIIK
ncbi:DUF5615 family PIN-like protein [Negadavirga shengliensis]|uniref:DUF5615 family PIN-like protein n=1 Tax=Negadavirga shengliensis TaxID=1389218 RepID=A0ABV9T6S3_9BACT